MDFNSYKREVLKYFALIISRYEKEKDVQKYYQLIMDYISSNNTALTAFYKQYQVIIKARGKKTNVKKIVLNKKFEPKEIGHLLLMITFTCVDFSDLTNLDLKSMSESKDEFMKYKQAIKKIKTLTKEKRHGDARNLVESFNQKIWRSFPNKYVGVQDSPAEIMDFLLTQLEHQIDTYFRKNEKIRKSYSISETISLRVKRYDKRSLLNMLIAHLALEIRKISKKPFYDVVAEIVNAVINKHYTAEQIKDIVSKEKKQVANNTKKK